MLFIFIAHSPLSAHFEVLSYTRCLYFAFKIIKIKAGTDDTVWNVSHIESYEIVLISMLGILSYCEGFFLIGHQRAKWIRCDIKRNYSWHMNILELLFKLLVGYDEWNLFAKWGGSIQWKPVPSNDLKFNNLRSNYFRRLDGEKLSAS